MRANAVYEVMQDFTDHYGHAFASGTRLTFVQRHFLPYEGGHTLCFREATIYLKDDSLACQDFERFFAFAKPQ